jgi:hypothetical protein
MSGLPPIPASPFMLDHLLGLLFLAHLLLMNYVLAAPFIASFYLGIQGTRGLPRAKLLTAVHPVAYTFAINSGVAALLFTQVIFGKYFYTANTILGWAWLSIIALIMLSFYGSYLLNNYLKRDVVNPRLAGMLGLFVGSLIVLVAVIMIANYFIGTSPDSWKSLLKKPGLVLTYSLFLPRFFHYATGAFAVSGFWMLWIGKYRLRMNPELEAAEQLRIDGLRVATGATALQIMTGLWHLFGQPPEVWERLFSGSFISAIWISGVIAGLLMLAALGLALLHHGLAIWHKIATGLLFWTLFGMIAGRDILRLAALEPAFKLREMPYETQTGAMLTFFVVLVIAIGTIVYLTRLVRPRPVDANKKPHL